MLFSESPWNKPSISLAWGTLMTSETPRGLAESIMKTVNLLGDAGKLSGAPSGWPNGVALSRRSERKNGCFKHLEASTNGTWMIWMACNLRKLEFSWWFKLQEWDLSIKRRDLSNEQWRWVCPEMRHTVYQQCCHCNGENDHVQYSLVVLFFIPEFSDRPVWNFLTVLWLKNS